MDWYFPRPLVCTCIIFLLVRQVKLEIEAIFYHLWAWSWNSDTTLFWLSCDDTQYCVQHRLRLYLFTLCRRDEMNFDCLPKHSSPYRPFCSCITACAYHWSCNWFKSIVSKTELDWELPNRWRYWFGFLFEPFIHWPVKACWNQSKPVRTGWASCNRFTLDNFFLYFCYYYFLNNFLISKI